MNRHQHLARLDDLIERGGQLTFRVAINERVLERRPNDDWLQLPNAWPTTRYERTWLAPWLNWTREMLAVVRAITGREDPEYQALAREVGTAAQTTNESRFVASRDSILATLRAVRIGAELGQVPGVADRGQASPRLAADRTTASLATSSRNCVMAFSSIAGVKHVVAIDGQPVPGFAASDVRFMRLLYLAAARKFAPNNSLDGGWVSDGALEDDDKHHEREALRNALVTCEHPALDPKALRMLLESSPKRPGHVRLAVSPDAIEFDPSLAELTLLIDAQASLSDSTAARQPTSRRAEDLEAGRLTAARFLRLARSLGVPGA